MTWTVDGRRAGRVAVVAALAAVAAIGGGGERWASAGEDGGAVALAESVPSVIVPLAPARILDTRTGVGAPAGRVAPGSTITLQVTGAGGVPAEATGVVLNLTTTVADGAGYVTAYPAGQQQPNASVINYSAGEDVANMVTAQLGEGGALAIFNDQANVHLLADVAGYLVPGDGGGEPGPQGPQGAQGPQGPAGPAGPGATLIREEFVTFLDTVVTTIDGIEIVGRCEGPMGNSVLKIWTPNASLLSLQGTWNYDITTSELNAVRNVQSRSETSLVAVRFNGIVSRGGQGATYQVDIGITSANPCRAWGSVIPVG